jgi:hypothetical protein
MTISSHETTYPRTVIAYVTGKTVCGCGDALAVTLPAPARRIDGSCVL